VHATRGASHALCPLRCLPLRGSSYKYLSGAELPCCRRCAGKDASYRLLMHPSGRSLVCGMSIGGLERVDLQPSSSGGPPQLSLSQGGQGRAQAGCAGCAGCGVLPRQLQHLWNSSSSAEVGAGLQELFSFRMIIF